MNYYEEIDKIVDDYQHPCDAEIPAGHYRRVMWELYNKDLSNKNPAVKEEWKTEIIPIEKRVYDVNPFGLRSELIPEPQAPETDPPTQPCALWSSKIGVCFQNQKELTDYVESIGSTLQSDNNWYGADLSKKDLFLSPIEESMYRLENTGATWSKQGPRVDKRTMMMYNDATKACTSINFNGTTNNRIAYMKHNEDNCTFTGMRTNTNADTSIPGTPVVIAVAVAALPMVISEICLPSEFGFPYTNISKTMLQAWNQTRDKFKLYWDSVPGLVSGAGDRIATMYDNLSVSMEELGNATLAMSQYALQLAWMEFKKIISSALNIVGGGWDMIKKFIPPVTILGVKVDLVDLCESGVQNLKTALKDKDPESVINSIYSAMGSAYDYSVEYVKMTSRDIVDALTDFYDWAWTQVQMAGVALCKLLGDLAQIWSMPPTVPNPLWTAILAVRNILVQIKPLDIILSGNFPGFTASDLYMAAEKVVKQKIDEVRQQTDEIEQQLMDTYQLIKDKTTELNNERKKFRQYLAGMWEQVKDETTEFYEQQLKKLEDEKQKLQAKWDALDLSKEGLLKQIDNVLDLGLKELKKLPMMSQVNQFLGMCGTSVDDIIEYSKNPTTGNDSMYQNFIDGSRSLKDMCKTIYNQISTLCISKVTQWVNKLLSLIGMIIEYPMMSFCTAMMAY
ncbi:MAG: hypothetical protein [Caudoviricetes sp.]|nr:MAG: hypothetical protein [Caudoviricetes sp.]